MAISSTIEYCTNRDLLDIFPQLSEFDLKARLYNFTSLGNNLYLCPNTGLVSQVYIDGEKQNNLSQGQSTSTVWKVNLAENLELLPDSDTLQYNEINLSGSFTTGSATDMYVGQYAKLTNTAESQWEIVYIREKPSTTKIVVTRNVDNSVGTAAPYGLSFSTSNGAYLTNCINLISSGQWYYDSVLDQLLVYSATDVNSKIVEIGDDWATIKQRFRRKASRFIESKLDSRMAKEILKDREGNYPPVIVHSTALQTILFLLKAHDPQNDLIEPLQSELDELVTGIKAGSIVLPSAISSDSSKGVIREVSLNSNSDLRAVHILGNYTGSGFDLIQLKVTTGGVIGTAKYSVWVKDSDKLKATKVVNSEVITGDYDGIGQGLYIRFAGDDDSAIATVDDEYEIEVFSAHLNADMSAVGSIKMTRR